MYLKCIRMSFADDSSYLIFLYKHCHLPRVLGHLCLFHKKTISRRHLQILHFNCSQDSVSLVISYQLYRKVFFFFFFIENKKPKRALEKISQLCLVIQNYGISKKLCHQLPEGKLIYYSQLCIIRETTDCFDIMQTKENWKS